MQTRILNLPDALKVASIINKYIPKSLDGMNIADFVLNLFSAITPDEGVILINTLLGDAPPPDNPEVIMKLCTDALIENKVVTLLDTYRDLGFK